MFDIKLFFNNFLDRKKNKIINTKPRCILHIGMPKTGTSSIQVNLSRRDVLKDCEYLQFGSAGNHSTVIFSLFSKKPELHHVHKAANRSYEEVVEYINHNKILLEKILRSVRTKQYIISGEDILFLEEDELLELRDWLMQFSSEIRIIAYVRPPVGFMQSAFQQKIKEGDLRFGIAGFYPKYQNRFEKFDRVFGQDNVFLKKYDADSLLAGDVVLDFCNSVGILINKESVIRVNESISLEAIALLYVFYKFNKNVYCVASEENYKLAEVFSEIGIRKLRYSKSLSDRIRILIEDDIQWMENRLKCSLVESIPDNDDNGISTEDDLIAIALANADMLCGLISHKIRQQLVSPNNIADAILLFRENSFLKAPFSNTQLSRLENPSIEVHDIIRELVLSLKRIGQDKAVQNIFERIPDLENFFNSTQNAECKISFSVDLYHNGCLMGWIVDRNNPFNKLNIEILQGQDVIAKGVADKFRKDLADAEIGDGSCAFALKLDTPLKNDGKKIILRILGLNQVFEIDINSIKRIEQV